MLHRNCTVPWADPASERIVFLMENIPMGNSCVCTPNPNPVSFQTKAVNEHCAAGFKIRLFFIL